MKNTPAAAAPEPEQDSSSLTRMLGTLQLFTREHPVLSAEQIARGAGVPTSTAYRYVKQLATAGLLVRWKGGYTLGPRIMELDLQIRECDPVIDAASEPMRELCAQTGLNALLTKLYGSTVMTVHIESTTDTKVLSYGRGRPLPLFRGSSSKAITAFLPAAKLRRLFEDGKSRTEEKLGDWESFHAAMSHIRRQGFALTVGELNSGIEGISAPVFIESRQVIGSITLIGDAARMALLREDAVVEMVKATAATVTHSLQRSSHAAS